MITKDMLITLSDDEIYMILFDEIEKICNKYRYLNISKEVIKKLFTKKLLHQKKLSVSVRIINHILGNVLNQE